MKNEMGLYYGPKELSFETDDVIMKKLAKAELPISVENRERFERHLFLCDFQIPDQNEDSINIIKTRFIPDLKPDHLHLMGDMVNFTRVSKYPIPVDYKVSLGDEIDMAKGVIFDLTEKARKAYPGCKVIWYEGNHEMRLQKYLARNADALGDVVDDEGEAVVTVPHLMSLKEHDIEWVPYYKSKQLGDVEIEHGEIIRVKAGYAAQAMIDRRGHSGISGHTHRLAFITRNQDGVEKFWIEAGSLCNPQPNPMYVKKPDWTNGFAVGIYDKKTKILHPIPVMFQKGQFAFNNKVYEP